MSIFGDKSPVGFQLQPEVLGTGLEWESTMVDATLATAIGDTAGLRLGIPMDANRKKHHETWALTTIRGYLKTINRTIQEPDLHSDDGDG